MAQEALQIHGSMFFLLNQFIRSNYEKETWLMLTQMAGVNETTYDVHKNYPASEMFSILSAASRSHKFQKMN